MAVIRLLRVMGKGVRRRVRKRGGQGRAGRVRHRRRMQHPKLTLVSEKNRTVIAKLDHSAKMIATIL